MRRDTVQAQTQRAVLSAQKHTDTETQPGCFNVAEDLGLIETSDTRNPYARRKTRTSI